MFHSDCHPLHTLGLDYSLFSHYNTYSNEQISFSFCTFLVTDSTLFAQPTSHTPIEFKGRKIYHKGHKVNMRKVKDLEAIIHPINDLKANALLESYKSARRTG